MSYSTRPEQSPLVRGIWWMLLAVAGAAALLIACIIAFSWTGQWWAVFGPWLAIIIGLTLMRVLRRSRD